MGYEGHAVLVADRAERARAHRRVDGHPRRARTKRSAAPILSGGGTGTYDVNTVATEIQAGSYALMDTAYAKLDIPFELALAVVATVIHTNPKWSVADCGLKALGMDHGNPTIADADGDVLLRRARDVLARHAGRASATACSCGPRTSTRPWRTTTRCTSPTVPASTRP